MVLPLARRGTPHPWLADIRVAISSTGTLSAISTVTVGSQISGQVTDVLVDYNDPVKRGQVIARIDPKTYQAQVAQGNAQIANARAAPRASSRTRHNLPVAERVTPRNACGSSTGSADAGSVMMPSRNKD